MKFFKQAAVVSLAAMASLAAGSALAGSYGGPAYGQSSYGQSYGSGPGMGMPYGMPPMTRPMRPQPPVRPAMPQRPTMWGPYGHGGLGKAPMRGGYGKPSAYGQAGGYAAPAVAAAPAAAPAEATEAASVSIAQMRFDAPTVAVKVGGTVTWTNSEAVPHTVVANDGSFSSAQLGAGDSFSHTFTEAGTYEYYCSVHPMMRATVVVEG